MDHFEAKSSNAAERYVLNELPESDVERFEQHYFGCPECGADVRHLAEIKAAIGSLPGNDPKNAGWSAVLYSWWSKPAVGVLVAASLVWFILLAAYQQRELSMKLQPQAALAFALAPATRGEAKIVDLSQSGQFAVLEADIPGASGLIQWELQRNGTPQAVGAGETAAPQAGALFQVVAPVSRLPRGEYTLTIRSLAGGGQSWMFRFKVV